MKKKIIYLFDSKISYKTFYLIWSKFPHGDVVPKEMINGEIIWQMIKAKELFVYIENDEIFFALKLPQNRDIKIIKDYEK